MCKSERSQVNYVIKQIDMKFLNEAQISLLLREVQILKICDHPNIVKCREVYQTKKKKLCIVMEYGEGGDLEQKIKSQQGHLFPESQILDWFTQMCLALKHVHDKKIIHRDIKSSNVFLKKDNTILLGDFGIAKKLKFTDEKAQSQIGTPYYLSPEIID